MITEILISVGAVVIIGVFIGLMIRDLLRTVWHLEKENAELKKQIKIMTAERLL